VDATWNTGSTGLVAGSMSGLLGPIRLLRREPVDVLRSLMRSGWREVIGRTWEIRDLAAIDLYNWDSDPESPVHSLSQHAMLFPEYGDQELPMCVTGMRLVERFALVNTLEDLDLVRLVSPESQDFDLQLIYDASGPGLLWIRDKETFDGMKWWAEQSGSSLGHP